MFTDDERRHEALRAFDHFWGRPLASACAFLAIWACIAAAALGTKLLIGIGGKDEAVLAIRSGSAGAVQSVKDFGRPAPKKVLPAAVLETTDIERELQSKGTSSYMIAVMMAISRASTGVQSGTIEVKRQAPSVFGLVGRTGPYDLREDAAEALKLANPHFAGYVTEDDFSRYFSDAGQQILSNLGERAYALYLEDWVAQRKSIKSAPAAAARPSAEPSVR